jgi:hypothetical protein
VSEQHSGRQHATKQKLSHKQDGAIEGRGSGAKDPFFRSLTAELKPRPSECGIYEMACIQHSYRYLSVSVETLELPPPGHGVNTVIGIVPGSSVRSVGTSACNSRALMNVVLSGLPFNKTSDELRNV